MSEIIMSAIAPILISIIILLHIYFLVLEMFLWDTPYGRRTFKLSSEFAKRTKTLAANQGLYNGFLAAGLFWGLIQGENGFAIKVFFLSCIVIAGIFGAFTVNKKIFFVQALPAVFALALILIPQA